MDSSRSSERGGSRASTVVFGSAVNRRLIDSPGGGLRNYDLENDLEVEDYGSVGSDLELSESDLEYSTGEEEDVEGDVEVNESNRGLAVKPEDQNLGKGDTISVDDSVEVDSDEERAIVAQIKDEIKQQVRGEMKSELELYFKPQEGETKANPEDDPSLDDLEPKLKEAILKMRKYDRILAKKEKREIEVKRERIRLQKRLRLELEELKKEIEGKQQPRRDELANTDKFLALVPPPKHSEDVTDESPPVTPVFTTQLPDSEFGERKDNASRKDSGFSTGAKENASTTGGRTNRSGGAKSSTSGTNSTASTSLGGKFSSQSDSSLGGRRSKKKKKKDFIERNIQLASDAANLIAMTEEEKSRVDNLLKDISNLPDIPEDSDSFQAFEVAIPAGDGFRADQGQRELLTGIDERLKSIAPERDAETLFALDDKDILKNSQYMTTDMLVSMNFEKLGEPTLRETKLEREMKFKLDDVEKQLELLSVHADMDVPTPSTLSEDALNILLGEYAESLQARTPQTNNYDDYDDEEGSETTPTPAIMNIYENAPKLDDDTLQKLLREAKSGMSFHELEVEDTLALGGGTDRTRDTGEYSRLSRRSSDTNRPNTDNERPNTGQERPNTGQERPNTGQERPNTGQERPNTGQERPNTGHERPNTGQERPNTGHERPNTGESRASNEPSTRVFLPEINLKRSLTSSASDRPLSRESRDRRSVSDDLIHKSLELTNMLVDQMAAESCPPFVAPPRRPPRNLEPISTKLDLNMSDDDVDEN